MSALMLPVAAAGSGEVSAATGPTSADSGWAEPHATVDGLYADIDAAPAEPFQILWCCTHPRCGSDGTAAGFQRAITDALAHIAYAHTARALT